MFYYCVSICDPFSIFGFVGPLPSHSIGTRSVNRSLSTVLASESIVVVVVVANGGGYVQDARCSILTNFVRCKRTPNS